MYAFNDAMKKIGELYFQLKKMTTPIKSENNPKAN
jgi:hypothetical protein